MFLCPRTDYRLSQLITYFIGHMSLFLSLLPSSISTLISLFLSPSMPRLSCLLSPSSTHDSLFYNFPILIIWFITVMIITSHLLYFQSFAFFSFSVLYALFHLLSPFSPPLSQFTVLSEMKKLLNMFWNFFDQVLPLGCQCNWAASRHDWRVNNVVKPGKELQKFRQVCGVLLDSIK